MDILTEETKHDDLGAAIISLAHSVFPVLNLTGVITLTSDEISAVMLVVVNVVTLGGLLWARRR